jgi:soluble lytic murein transglycosylase-like protein
MGAVILALTVLCCGPPAAPEPALTVTVLEPEPASPAAAPTVPTVEQLIRAAAARYGLSPTRLLRLATCESSLNPRAVGPGGHALGLFQFTGPTWGEVAPRAGYTGASPFDPAAASMVAAWAISRGQSWRWRACGGY